MKIQTRKTGKTENHEATSLIVFDDKDNRFRIMCDKFGGINILAEDGAILIEPHVSNDITLKMGE